MFSDTYEYLRNYFADPASGSLATHIALVVALLALIWQKSSFSWQSKTHAYEQRQDVFERYLSEAWLIYFELQNEILKAQFKFETNGTFELEKNQKNLSDLNLIEVRMARYSDSEISAATNSWSDTIRACKLELQTLSKMLDPKDLHLTEPGERQKQFATIRNFNSLLESALEGLELAFAKNLVAAKPRTIWKKILRKTD